MPQNGLTGMEPRRGIERSLSGVYLRKLVVVRGGPGHRPELLGILDATASDTCRGAASPPRLPAMRIVAYSHRVRLRSLSRHSGRRRARDHRRQRNTADGLLRYDACCRARPGGSDSARSIRTQRLATFAPSMLTRPQSIASYRIRAVARVTPNASGLKAIVLQVSPSTPASHTAV